MAPLLQIGLLVLSVKVIFAIIGPKFFSGALKKTRNNLENISLRGALNSIGKAMMLLHRICLTVILATAIFANIGIMFYTSSLHEAVKDAENLMTCDPRAELLELIRPKRYDCRKDMCLKGMLDPNYNNMSVVNKGVVFVTVVQCFAVKGWNLSFYWVKDTLLSAIDWLYFVLLIVLGSFLMLNLGLRVISGSKWKIFQRPLQMQHKMAEQIQ